VVKAPTAVYRLYDADDNLIYVGISDSLGIRFGTHSRREWWPRVVRYTLSWHEHRRQALAEEAKAITHELPAENLMVPVSALVPDFAADQLVDYTPEPSKPRREKGSGALYQRTSDGRWIGAITVRGKRKAVSARTREDAQAKLAALRESVR
jgi:predicted GIY-YIG superfamily endonuclease